MIRYNVNIGFGLAVFLLVIGAFFLYALFFTLFGAFIGFVVGLIPFVGDSVKYIWNNLTGMNVECWQIGAFMGFIVGFFNGLVKVEKKE